MVIRSLLQTVQLIAPAGPHLAVVESSLRSRQMTPLHVHPGDEALQVVEGAVTVHSGGDVFRLGAGDSLLLPGGEPHTVRADAQPTRIRTGSHVASVGRYEDFLRAVAAPGPLNPEDEAALAAIAYVNGIRVVGPPGALPSADAARAA
jgi:quercetin dioxygenase-like cupin family protein